MMPDDQTISWIFLATAVASQAGPTDFESISTIADGINHAVPTHKELQTSMAWLTSKGLISKKGNKYALTAKGQMYYEQSSKSTSILLKIWDNLEVAFNKYRT